MKATQELARAGAFIVDLFDAKVSAMGNYSF